MMTENAVVHNVLTLKCPGVHFPSGVTSAMTSFVTDYREKGRKIFKVDVLSKSENLKFHRATRKEAQLISEKSGGFIINPPSTGG